MMLDSSKDGPKLDAMKLIIGVSPSKAHAKPTGFSNVYPVTTFTLMYTSTIFSQVSAHLRVSTHLPFFDYIMVCVYNYALYVQMASLCKLPTPVSLPVKFKHPWALTQETTVLVFQEAMLYE